MAIKEPGHGLIMIRRVRAHDRGLCVCVVCTEMYVSVMSYVWVVYLCVSVQCEDLKISVYI